MLLKNFIVEYNLYFFHSEEIFVGISNNNSINFKNEFTPIFFFTKTIWEGGVYPLTMQFTEEYPDKPPKCSFPKGICQFSFFFFLIISIFSNLSSKLGFFHPNIYPSGTVCLSLLNEEKDWKPSITLKQILIGIQELLSNPNPQDPAQEPAYNAFTYNKTEYTTTVKIQAQNYKN